MQRLAYRLHVFKMYPRFIREAVVHLLYLLCGIPVREWAAAYIHPLDERLDCFQQICHHRGDVAHVPVNAAGAYAWGFPGKWTCWTTGCTHLTRYCQMFCETVLIDTPSSMLESSYHCTFLPTLGSTWLFIVFVILCISRSISILF